MVGSNIQQIAGGPRPLGKKESLEQCQGQSDNVFFFVFLFVSGEPCFQGRPIRFRILVPSPFIHTKRPVTGPCRKLLARYFGSLGSSQSQRPAERRVPRSFYCSSTPEREGIVPLYDIFVTQRATLGSALRQCYCVFQQQLQLEGESDSVWIATISSPS